jgi:hypothetical protein
LQFNLSPDGFRRAAAQKRKRPRRGPFFISRILVPNAADIAIVLSTGGTIAVWSRRATTENAVSSVRAAAASRPVKPPLIRLRKSESRFLKKIS